MCLNSRVLIGLAIIGVAACRSNSPMGGGGEGQATSGLSTIEVAVPAATAEAFGSTAKLEVMTHVHFLVQPKDPNCAKATKIDSVSLYTKSSISETVYNGCDYYLTLSLGKGIANESEAVVPTPVIPPAEGGVSQDQQGIASKRIAAVYTNFKATEVSSASLESSGGKLDVPVILDLTKFGQENGYTTEVKMQK